MDSIRKPRVMERVLPGRTLSEWERLFRWLYYFSGNKQAEENRRLHAQWLDNQMQTT